MKWFFIFLTLIFSGCSNFQPLEGGESLVKLCQEGDALACRNVARDEFDSDRKTSLYYYRKACDLGDEKSCDRVLVMSFTHRRTREYAMRYEKTCRERGNYYCSVVGKHFFRLGDSERAVKAWEEGCEREDFGSCVQLSQWAWSEGQKGKAHDAVNRACSIPSKGKMSKNDFLSKLEEKLRSCLLSGLWYFESGEKELAENFYARSCQMASLKGETRKEGYSLTDRGRLYQMLGCSRAGALSPFERKTWFELGHEYLKSRCQRGQHKRQFQDCYDLAALESLNKRPGPATRYLRMAITKGFRNWKHLLNDPEMAALRESPEFVQLIKEVKQKLGRGENGQTQRSGH